METTVTCLRCKRQWCWNQLKQYPDMEKDDPDYRALICECGNLVRCRRHSDRLENLDG